MTFVQNEIVQFQIIKHQASKLTSINNSTTTVQNLSRHNIYTSTGLKKKYYPYNSTINITEN